MNVPPDICPCDTDCLHETYCGPLHEDSRPAVTAVALIRSQCSAYALGLRDYLLEIWRPNTRPEPIDPKSGPYWTGLTVEHSEVGKTWDKEGMVVLSATWEEGDQTGTMREVSSFLRVDSR